MCNKLKSWWHILKTLNIRKRTLECTWEHFETQSSFWIKVELDLMVRWRKLDKINVHKVYNVHLFNGHRASCLCSVTHYQTKEKWKNNTIHTYKIFSFFVFQGNGFFPQIRVIMHLLLKKCKNTFFEWIFNQKI